MFGFACSVIRLLIICPTPEVEVRIHMHCYLSHQQDRSVNWNECVLPDRNFLYS
jgi:hypothetical protein